MKRILSFLNRLENNNIHYTLHHHREEYIMVKVDVPGERWEVEFGENEEVEIEVFKNLDGVHSDMDLLEGIFRGENEG